MLLSPSEVPLTVPQLSGANSKSAYKDQGKQISCLWSDASPVSAVAAWSFHLRADYSLRIPRLRHSMWFRHVDGAVRQTFALLALPLPHVVVTPRWRKEVCWSNVAQSSSRQPSKQTAHGDKLIFSFKHILLLKLFSRSAAKEMTNQRGAAAAALTPYMQPQTPSV